MYDAVYSRRGRHDSRLFYVDRAVQIPRIAGILGQFPVWVSRIRWIGTRPSVIEVAPRHSTRECRVREDLSQGRRVECDRG